MCKRTYDGYFAEHCTYNGTSGTCIFVYWNTIMKNESYMYNANIVIARKRRKYDDEYEKCVPTR